MELIPLITPRLELRAYTPEDRPLLVGLVTDPSVTRYVDDGAMTLEHAHAWYDKVLVTPSAKWAIRLRDTGAYVGHLYLPWYEPEQAFSFGYMLKAAYWGQGLATEAGKAGLEDAQDRLRLAPIIATIDEANGASVRVAEKLGFVLEARIEDAEGAYFRYVLPDRVQTG